MERNTEKAVFFDSQVSAPWASLKFSEDELNKINRMLELADLKSGMRVLEPGCGTGRLTEFLSKAVGCTGEVHAFEISEQMFREAAKRTALQEIVFVHLSSVEKMHFPPDFFDAVICHNVFPHFDNKAKTLEVFSQVLKFHGTVIVFHFMNSDWINDLHRKTDPAVLHDLMPGRLEVYDLFRDAGFAIEYLEDGEQGYLLKAKLTRSV